MSTTDRSAPIIFKVHCDKDGVFTVDFTDKEEPAWLYTTEWTCIPSSGKCGIACSGESHKYYRELLHYFDNLPTVKVASLRNPEQKVVLVLKHDTRESAVGMMCKLTDVKDTVLNFLRHMKIPVGDLNVSVQLKGLNEPAEEQNGGACLFQSTPDTTKKYTLETIWLCVPDAGFKGTDVETSEGHFSKLKGTLRKKYNAFLNWVRSGSVKFFVLHENTQDALEMISHYEEVMALILECLQGIDSTVKDIQMDVKLQDFIDARSLPEHGDQDKRYVDKQEYDKVVQDLSEQVAALKQQLQETKEMEQAQLADLRMSMWMTKPGSPPPSDSGLGTATDTMTDVGDEEFHGITDLPELEGGHRQKGDASEPQHTSQTVTDLRKQLEDTRQELKATTERMHRLEIAQRKAWSEREAPRPGTTQKSDVPARIRKLFTRKSGTQSRPDTRATPTPARRDARAVADLHDACRNGNLAEVKRILDTGRADVNSRGVGSRTPVMSAAGRGHRDVVEFLVSRGADVSLVDGDGDNILHYACMGGDRKTVEFVLSLDGADVNSRGEGSTTPVMAAARWGHRDVVEFLVSRGADVSLVDGDGDNILHHACMGGDRKTVEFVLSLDGVDVNSRGERSRTPVMEAAWRGHRDVVEFLVSRGADVSLVDGVGNNILHYACWGGDRKTVEFVVSLDGVDVNSRGGVGSRTPVMAAAGWRHRDVVEFLVSRGADVSLVDGVGDNILHYACWGGDRRTVEFVLSLDGVDVNARNNVGETAADVARRRGHRQLSDFLVSRDTR